jgi:hypothetical protein
MDPLSIAASLVGIVDAARKAGETLRSLGDSRVNNAGDQLEDLKLEMFVHVDILDTISREIIEASSLYFPTFEKIITLCRDRLGWLLHLISKAESRRLSKSIGSEINDAIMAFARAVKLLHDMASRGRVDHLERRITQLLDFSSFESTKTREAMFDLHRGLRAQVDHSFEILQEQMGDLAPQQKQDIRTERQQADAALQDLRESLRSTVQPSPVWRTNTGDSDSDPFTFSATIIRPHEDESEHVTVRGRLDSGCDDNWVSLHIIKRAGLEGDIDLVEDGMKYAGFGGQHFTAKGRVEITWFASNGGISRKTTFLVHDDPPFDLVLGRVFIAEQSVFVFDRAALALRHGNFTQGKMFDLWC